MEQVVDEAGLTWLDTPDQAVVWGTALGLQGDIEAVLPAQPRGPQGGTVLGVVALLPGLVPDRERLVLRELPASGGSGASLFSGSAVPDLGGMMSAIGTIGNSPASSGSGGGGFGGGGIRWRRRRAGGGF